MIGLNIVSVNIRQI